MTTTKTKPTPKGAHTPGPWENHKWNCEEHQISARGGTIALVGHSHTLVSEAEADANGCLIAAAPELLEELRNCVRHNADILDNCLFPAHGLKANLTPEQALWREKIKKWNTETRAAIAKATGQN
jgi:hypothetical protein